VAGDLLLDLGYHDLNMGRIADAMEVSRGTIYACFKSKEELLLAMAIKYLEIRLRLMERATTFSARPRERMLAVGEAAEPFTRLYPREMRIIELVRTRGAKERASFERQLELQKCEYHAAGILLGIVRDAIACGDLSLPRGTSAETLVFGFLAITGGAYASVIGALTLPDMGVKDVFTSVRENCILLADGYGWHPLSEEWDYDGLIRRIREDLFREEWQVVKGS
ncbi:MAG: TetR/AcrR family transcriptional regulator, partial [Candidatus Hydrogenedentes bacterium]|nr:TetR/AcrR family transcriptional regulator [Candidatus Hydrogenedentota bacterium]